MDTPKPLPVGLKTETLHACLPMPGEPLGSVEAVDICDLMEVLYPGYWDEQRYLKITYEVSRNRVESWCREHGAHYYARPREEFSTYEAREEALSYGLRRVVLEDLS
jgi:hypothetical protein